MHQLLDSYETGLFYFTLFLMQTCVKLLTQIYTTEFHRVSRTMDAVFSEKNTLFLAYLLEILPNFRKKIPNYIAEVMLHL